MLLRAGCVACCRLPRSMLQRRQLCTDAALDVHVATSDQELVAQEEDISTHRLAQSGCHVVKASAEA